MTIEIKLNVENLLYQLALKKAHKQEITFDEYVWRLVKKDLRK